MASRFALLLSAVLVGSLGLPAQLLTAQQGRGPAGDISLPPLSWACPMNGVALPDGSTHADVYEPAKGNCPICRMALTAVRLDSIWTCPVHSVINEKSGGKCPIDRRDLVPLTVGVSWTCAGRPEIDQIAPGRCPDGSAMVVKYTPRPHGNHNPQHGGQFFMAPDNWHHLEGTFPRARVVRMYVYDNYTRPLPRDRMKTVQGRIVTKAADTGAREVSFPLALSRSGQYLEASVDSRALPAAMAAKIQLKADGPEYHFDFTFTEFSKDLPPAASRGAAVAAPPTQTPAITHPMPDLPAAATTAPASSPTAVALPARIEVPIPETVEEIVAQIGARNRQIGELIDRGRLTDVWLPAFEAKDLALAVKTHAAHVRPDRLGLLDPAVARLLRAAWLLDGFGDLGNREKIAEAYAEFKSAVSELESLVQD